MSLQALLLPLPPIAQVFARWAGRQHQRLTGQQPDPLVLAGAAAAAAQLEEGHICADLASLAQRRILAPEDALDEAAPEAAEGEPPRWPALRPWLEALQASPLVGDGSAATPLALHGRRLYLCRYWRYEQALAHDAAQRAAERLIVDDQAAQRIIARLFDPGQPALLASGGVDFQAVAARTALERRLAVITGGPGTGKTTTVVRLLALLLEQAGPSLPSIALLAPTGKAAARLAESIELARSELSCPAQVKAAIPHQAATLHRALGWQPHSPTRFRHDRENPLPADIVVVDEASMVPLALMAKLMQAVRPSARLVLLGDRDQLASVEPGAVLGELCRAEALQPAVVRLRYSYRFAARAGIGALAHAINQGDEQAVMQALHPGRHAEVGLLTAPQGQHGQPLSGRIAQAALRRALEPRVSGLLAPYLQAADPAQAFERFTRFRVLCAHRGGALGVRSVNRLVELLLAERGLQLGEGHYAHQPLLVIRNDYGVQLFNGDVGLVLPDQSRGGQLRAFFQGADRSIRSVPLGRLPPCETVFAMTVHKAQGSEFDDVMLVLPSSPSRILTRELVYTGVTRARQRAEIYGSEEVLRAAVRARVERSSGLGELLGG